MTTPEGIAHCIRRLSLCRDLSELKARWDCIAKAYQHEAQVSAHKDKMKETLKWADKRQSCTPTKTVILRIV